MRVRFLVIAMLAVSYLPFIQTNTPPTVSAMPLSQDTACDWSGTWDIIYGGGGYLYLVQSGMSVSGDNGNTHYMGTFSDNILKGTWSNPTSSGVFGLVITDDCTEISGYYGTSPGNPLSSIRARRVCDASILPSGIDVCTLQPGDILIQKHHSPFNNNGMSTIGGTYYTHAAIYVGNGNIIEAIGYGATHQEEIVEWAIDKPDHSYWASASLYDWVVIRPYTTQAIKDSAIAYARTQVNDNKLRYNIFAKKDQLDKVYCTLLVWRAYNQAGLNLEFDRGIVSVISSWVTADDLYYSSGISRTSQVVQEKARPPVANISRWVLWIYSPAHLMLIDPQGRKSGFDFATGTVLNEIPGVLYTPPGAQLETITVTGDGTPGNWQLVLTGYKEGTYEIAAGSVDDLNLPPVILKGTTFPGKVERFAISDPTTASTIHTTYNVLLPLVTR